MRRALLLLSMWPVSAAAQSPFSEIDAVPGDSGGVVKGLKLVVEGIGFDRGPALETRVNPALLFGEKLRTVRQFREAYADDWLNPRNIELSASVGALAAGGEVSSKVGDWRLGARWNVFDSTQPLRPAAIDRAEARARALAQVGYAVDKREQVVAWVDELLALELADRCVGTSSAALLQERWPADVAAARSEVAAAWEELVRAAGGAAHAAGSCPRVREERSRQILARRLGRILFERIQPRPGGQCVAPFDGSLADLVRLGPSAEARSTELLSAWTDLCLAAFKSAREERERLLAALGEEIRNGAVVGLETFLSQSATATRAAGEEELQALRSYGVGASLKLALRHLRPDTSFELAVDLISVRRSWNGETRLHAEHGLDASLELLRGQLNDSSLVLGLKVRLQSSAAQGDDERMRFEERLSVPLRDKVSLAFVLTQVDRGGALEVTPALSLSWAYEQDGKEAARSVDFLR